MPTSSLRLALLSLIFLTPATFSPAIQAASVAEVALIHDAVRHKFPDLSIYCKLSETERRQTTVQITMALAMGKKLSDPFAAGQQAGNLLRRECGLEAPEAAAVNVRWTASATPLTFDDERKTLGLFTSAPALSNRIYTPDGPGPFPAVVLNHTIGGVSQHLLTQAKILLDEGFAVLVVDSYGPRNIRPGNILFPAEVAKDDYDALAHLMKQPYIDKNRIFQAGYSLGAIASTLLASPEGAQIFKAPARFRASVGHYGTCALQSKVSASKVAMLNFDSDRPLLMLMAELDIETPPMNCFPLLEDMKAAGKDVHWHIYKNATHGWDKSENNGFTYRAASGESMTYRYDPAITKDATERMVTFFNQYR